MIAAREHLGRHERVQPDFIVTAPPASASLSEVLKLHWREYLMEAAELGTLMLCICFFAALRCGSGSPLESLALSSRIKPFLMGGAVAGATFVIIQSPFGRRTGAHFNPALTLAYFFLGRVHRWDTAYYIAFQFAVGLVEYLLRTKFSVSISPPVPFPT